MILFLVMGIYFTSSWVLRQETLAMKAWGIQISNLHNQGISWGQAWLRYLLAWPLIILGLCLILLLIKITAFPAFYVLIVFTPFLNLLSSFFHSDSLMLHERLSKTRLRLKNRQ